jgi:hypothetical protein
VSRPALLLTLLMTTGALLSPAACSDDSTPAAPGPTPSPPAPAPAPAPQPGPAKVTIGPGTHRVGVDVPPGRYFSDPSGGCYWERQSGTGGTAAETIAFAFIGFDALQWIVDIQNGDHSFDTNAACGSWADQPGTGMQATIDPGTWLVGAQVLAATYRTAAAVGCYWERLADFGGRPDSVIANSVVATAGPAFVTILASDAGFRSDAACGQWARVPDSANGLRRAQ